MLSFTLTFKFLANCALRASIPFSAKGAFLASPPGLGKRPDTGEVEGEGTVVLERSKAESEIA